MLRYLVVICAILMVALIPAAADPFPLPRWEDWNTWLAPGGGGVVLGVHPGCGDGYDGQEPVVSPDDITGFKFYRENGPSWTGPTGFYLEDYMAPIEPGDSKTWSDLYLWAQGFTPAKNLIRISVGSIPPSGPPPIDYTAKLVLDHVPAVLNYTGPMEFDVDLQRGVELYLPAVELPGVADPLHDDITRMHFTVYAPIPEPSSLPALGFALAGLGFRRIRSKRA